MKKILQFLMLFFTTAALGQGGVGEVLIPLKVNQQLVEKHKAGGMSLLKAAASKSYFIRDTLSVPFIDDFSTDQLKRYDTTDYNLSLAKDSSTFNFTADAIPVDTLFYSKDTTWILTYHDTIPDSLITQISNLPQIVVINYNNPYNPFVPSDTANYWLPYDVYDTINLPSSPDTIDTINVNVDTLINAYDTLRVFPPDTIGAGITKSLWLDDHVYLNSTFPIDPISIGVATFDGLDSSGKAYNAFSDPLGYGIADYLTSKPMNLNFSAIDSVFLSFYYQPQGNGNDPQKEDSLVLEFYDPDKIQWHHIWSVPGMANQKFKQVMLQIGNPKFLKKGFQFRFKNYATLSGNFDHWNLDYVRLFSNRGIRDTTVLDLVVVEGASSALADYQAMPWNHFKQDTTESLIDSQFVEIGNLDTNNHTPGYRIQIVKDEGPTDSIYDFPGGTNNATVSAVSVLRRALEMEYNFYTDTMDSATFIIKNYITPDASDTTNTNDTLEYIQRFYNYYAYDDGSAESAYGINATGGKLAYRFSIGVTDTLRAINMYFSQVLHDASLENFYLTVWSSLNPETIVYQEASVKPVYEDSLNKFHTYILNSPIVLSGTFYIGWVQTSETTLNIGFDKNNNSTQHLYYNVTGSWLNSILNGAVMIRPLFGDSVILPVGVQSYNAPSANDFDFLIYPNPANDIFHITQVSGEEAFITVRIFDLYGRLVKSADQNIHAIDVANLEEGIYIVELTDEDSGNRVSKKIFISR